MKHGSFRDTVEPPMGSKIHVKIGEAIFAEGIYGKKYTAEEVEKAKAEGKKIVMIRDVRE